ncbi:MAG TPA: hypothetical protein VKQ31_11760 [Steroidobacteraceae bacterium]|nr:hypothetical protein [Steroidobacteraceae bacterium]
MSTQNSDNISPFVVGVSGHRDIHPDALQQLRTSVSRILRQLAERLPDSELRITAGMAAGADLLVVQTALELGFRVDALLPMPLADYAKDFDPPSLTLLETLLAHPCVSCRELPLSEADRAAGIAAGSPGRDALYGRVSRSLIRGCSLLLALWDGEPSLLPNGTADTVLRYLGVRTDRNKDDERLQFSDSSPDPDIAARLVYWIPTARMRAGPAAEARSPCFLTGLGDNALLRLPTMPHRLEVHLRSLNIYNREYLRFASSRWPAPRAPDSLMRDLPAQLRSDPTDRGVLERIDLQYGKADALALHFQRRSDRLFAFFNLVAFAMGLAYLVYEKFISTRLLLFAYLLILTSSAVVYYVLHERHWFAKHLMCRALAETLRVKFYLRLAHGDQLVDAEEVLSLSGINSFHGFGWMGHVLTAVEAPPSYSEQEPGADVAGLDESWIENQRQYFIRKVGQLHRSAMRTKWMKRTLFGVIIAVVLVLLLLGGERGAGLTPGGSLENVLTFLMGLVAVTLASWELHQNKMASRELLWQYRNQLKHFSRARVQLSRTVAFGRRLEILAELGRDSLMESYLWTIHRFHREHEPPGRA